MVLQAREVDLVVSADIMIMLRPSDQVDRLRCRGGEDDVVDAGSVDKLRYALARGFVVLAGLLRQGVEPAVHWAIKTALALADGFDDRARLEGGGGVVEIAQRLAARLLAKDGELRTQGLHFLILTKSLRVRSALETICPMQTDYILDYAPYTSPICLCGYSPNLFVVEPLSYFQHFGQSTLFLILI